MAENDRRTDEAAADSLSSAVDQHMDAQRVSGDQPVDTEVDVQMVGHPALENPITPEPEPEVSPESEPQPKIAPEATPDPSHRFSTWEEAEAAHAEAQKRISEQAQQAEWLQQRIDAIEAERAQATPEPEPEPAPEPEPIDFNARDHWANAFRKVEQLDPDAADYEDRRLDIMAEAQDEANKRIFEAVDQRTASKIATETQKALGQFRQETQEMLQQQTAQTEAERKRGKLLRMATEAGLDVSEPTQDNQLGGTHFNDLELAVQNGLYPHDADEDTAIQAVIKLVAERHGVAPPATSGDAAPTSPGSEIPADVRQTQALNTPMERNGLGRTTPTPSDDNVEPATMEDVVQRIMQPRMVKS